MCFCVVVVGDTPPNSLNQRTERFEVLAFAIIAKNLRLIGAITADGARILAARRLGKNVALFI